MAIAASYHLVLNRLATAQRHLLNTEIVRLTAQSFIDGIKPDSVSALVDCDDLRPSPCVGLCCRLLFRIAFKGQEKGNVTPPNAGLQPQILGIVRRSSYGTLRECLNRVILLGERHPSAYDC